MSLRSILMSAAGSGLLFFAVIVCAFLWSVVPAIREISRRSHSAREQYAERTRLARQVDSVLVELHRLAPASSPAAAAALAPLRERLEAMLEQSSVLQPSAPSTAETRDIALALTQTDASALDAIGMMMGAVGALEARDPAGAREMLADADRSRQLLQERLTGVTLLALEELERENSVLLERARSAVAFGVGWLAFGALLVVVLGAIIRWRLLVPLERIDRALSELEAGQAEIDLPAPRDDELGRLAQHLARTAVIVREQRDTATRLAAQEALEASAARYNSAFDDAAVGMAEISREGRYLRVNREMCRILGAEASEIVGHSFTEFTAPEDAAIDEDSQRRLLTLGEPVVRVQKRYRRPDGTRVSVQLSATLLREADGTDRHVLSVVHDVTEQRRLEREVLHAQKMEAIGQLAGGVAHDFNNLLAAIIGFADLLEHDAAQSAAIRDDAASIRKAALRGADLAQSLLTLGRRHVRREEPFALDPMIRETVELLQRTFDRRIRVHAVLDSHATILGDRSLLSNAVLNLAFNARDAMPDGGELTLTTTSMRADDAIRRAYGLAASVHEVAVLHVTDTGSGMPPNVVARVFEPFFTTKDPGKGTGLGLSMVYGTVQDHGGTISVESAVGRGTQFRIVLPMTARRSDVADAPRDIAAATKRATILVVDDEDLVRQVAMRMLSRLGYDVEAASDGMAALERLAREHHGIDLVLLDGNMPRLNGLETARRLLARHPTLRIVYASGYFDAGAEEALTQVGVLARLAKPYSLDQLAKVVERCLQSRPESPEAKHP